MSIKFVYNYFKISSPNTSTLATKLFKKKEKKTNINFQKKITKLVLDILVCFFFFLIYPLLLFRMML